jgi:hypothetical protein
LKCLYQDRTAICHVRVYESITIALFNINCTLVIVVVMVWFFGLHIPKQFQSLSPLTLWLRFLPVNSNQLYNIRRIFKLWNSVVLSYFNAIKIFCYLSGCTTTVVIKFISIIVLHVLLKCLYQDRTAICHVRVYESYEYRIVSVCTIYSKILELLSGKPKNTTLSEQFKNLIEKQKIPHCRNSSKI